MTLEPVRAAESYLPKRLSYLLVLVLSPVADACAKMAPEATPNGFCAAPRAIVVRKDRSPNSAANTNENVCRIRALCKVSNIQVWDK